MNACCRYRVGEFMLRKSLDPKHPVAWRGRRSGDFNICAGQEGARRKVKKVPRLAVDVLREVDLHHAARHTPGSDIEAGQVTQRSLVFPIRLERASQRSEGRGRLD